MRLTLPPQHAYAPRPKHEQSSPARLQAYPARRQYPQNVRMRKQRNIPDCTRLQGTRDHSIRAFTNPLHSLATHNRVLPHRPPRNLHLDLLRGPALIHPVVPLLQTILHLCHVPEPGNLARLLRAQHGTPQHRREPNTLQILPQLHGPLPAALRERQIRTARVPPVRAPLRLPMTYQPELPGGIAAHLLRTSLFHPNHHPPYRSATVAPMKTQCCIVGGGPAGMMLGYLLARSGVHVTVLEKHADFFRDFRGDTIHPSTLQLLHELNLLEPFLQIPHSKIERLSGTIGGEVFPIADLTHLPTICKYIALMPQWDFLNFLAAEAAKYPNFALRMSCEATGLLSSPGQVSGVCARTSAGDEEIPADLVVGCDGRHALTRDAAHLAVIEQGVPIDVLWLQLPRSPGDPENALGYINFGRVLILINRDTYFQCGYLVRKGSFADIQQAGLPAFRQSIERLAPFLAGRTETIDSWDKVKLLTIQINHLAHWSAPGLLCIGDCAHAMSPVGGIGINIALQDAVAAANILAEPLRTGTLTPHHLRWVQNHRLPAVRRTQTMQAGAHRLLQRMLGQDQPLKPPLALRVVTHIPGFQRLVGRIVGIGLQPEHVQTPILL